MNKGIYFLAILFLALLQATLLDSFQVFNVKPDLLLISAVVATFAFPFRWAILFSIFAGALKDCFCISAFGLNLLIFPLWSFLIIELSRKISLDSNFLRAALVCIIVAVNNIVFRPLYFFLKQINIPLGIFLRTTILEAIYTALVLPLIFKLFKKYNRNQDWVL